MSDNELSNLRKEYKALVGKNPSPRLDVEGLKAKIAEVQAAAANGGDQGGNDAAEKPAPKAKTVKMKRDAEVYPDGPLEADVHPAEVDNYRAAGFEEA